MRKLFALILMLFVANSMAAEDKDKLVTLLGITGDKAHFKVEGNFSETCKFNVDKY